MQFQNLHIRSGIVDADAVNANINESDINTTMVTKIWQKVTYLERVDVMINEKLVNSTKFEVIPKVPKSHLLSKELEKEYSRMHWRFGLTKFPLKMLTPTSKITKKRVVTEKRVKTGNEKTNVP